MIRRAFQKLPKSCKGFLPWSQTNAALISHSFCNQKQPPKENQEISELIKQMRKSDEEKRLYQIKMEEERIKKEEEQRKEKLEKYKKDEEESLRRIQMLEERIEKLKKDEEVKKQDRLYLIKMTEHLINKEEQNNKILNKLTAFGIIIGSILTAIGLGYVYMNTDEYKWSKLREQHLKDFIQNTDFVHGKSIENQIRSIIQNKSNTLELILGVQGIGKTSAVKKLIREKRQKAKQAVKEERIYYYSLRSEQQKTDPNDNQSILQIQKMVQLIKAINQQYDGSVPTTLVIDDINTLEKQKDELKRMQNQDQIIKLNRRGVKVILISSSTSFYHNIWINELFRKYMNKKQHIIWMMSEQQAKQILQKRGSQLKIDQKVVEKVINFGQPLRNSIALLAQIPKWEIKQQQELMKKLQNKFQGLKERVVDQIKGVFFRNNINEEAAYQILNGLTKNEINKNEDVQSINRKNCYALYKKVDELEKQKMLPSFAIKELDKENLIIMCYPRSKLIMKAFEEKLQQLKKKLKK